MKNSRYVLEGILAAAFLIVAISFSGLLCRLFAFAWRCGFDFPDLLFSLLH